MDIRDTLFKTIQDQQFRAFLTVEKEGLLAGMQDAVQWAEEAGIIVEEYKKDGDAIHKGDVIACITAKPKEIAIAEESMIGLLAKASGIATAAAAAVKQGEGKVRIVSGSWKKMPPQVKGLVRNAVAIGGAHFRICDVPMVYIDKNFIRMFGGITPVLKIAGQFTEMVKVVQIRGIINSIVQETREAVYGGAGILMVDTGKLEDLEQCISVVQTLGVRDKVRIAFASGVKIRDIEKLKDWDLDMLCIGKEIVDAPLLDMKLDVIIEE